MSKRKAHPIAWRLLLGLIPLLLTMCHLTAAESRDGIDFFERRIRPVLIERCYKCHSAESEKIKGGLLLDTNAGLLKGGDGGAVIVPGHPEKSRLIEAIRYENKDLQMPPKSKLSDQQITDFVAWVNLGAPDPRTGAQPVGQPGAAASRVRKKSASATDHWAFQPVRAYPIPRVGNVAWPKAPVDFFILQKLENKGLSPAPPADKRTLIRRATFDLTGLPPSAEEVNDFLNDESAEAFSRVVDRLLASPRYGERWGRYWLDVARYADTKGYVYTDREEARFVHSSAYRDWVIRAFNDDMPYDRFLMLQMAADQLAPSSSEQIGGGDSLAAMGFLTLGRRFLGVVHDIIDDRIDVVMRGTQALTVGCARCHDHKFDPIPIKDYYSLYGVFAGCTEKMVALHPSSANKLAQEEYEKGMRERVAKYEQTLEKKRVEFSNRFRAKVTDYLVAVLDVKKLPTEEHYEIRGPNDLNPTVVRTWENYLLQAKQANHPLFRIWNELEAVPEKDFSNQSALVLSKYAGSQSSSNNVNNVLWQALSAKPLASMRDVAERYGQTLQKVHQQWESALQNAVTNKMAVPTRLPDPDHEELRQVLYGANAPVNIPILAAADLEWYFDEGTRVELMKLHAEIERWIIKSPGAPPYALTLEDRPVQKNPRVLLRGNPANKGEEVPRQFLQVLSGENRRPFQSGSGRLELARAIASPENPLTARVMVNRIWLHHFGAGLVRTPSDFGTRCESPSHPELLDWLARYFVTHNWSIKAMHRLMMLSSVYQQSSDPSRESIEPSSSTPTEVAFQSTLTAAAVDPDNRLLWHMNRRRLDFETLRDSLLAVSGELDAKMGGKPIDLFKNPITPQRTIYGFVDRQFLPGIFRVFDFANPDMHSPQRSDTTVPQQALFFMNSPFVVERARAITQSCDSAPAQSRENRIQQLYQRLYQRPATPQQAALALDFLNAAEAEPPYETPPPPPPVWFYGYGEFNEITEQLTNFSALPTFTEDAWQGGEKWPDEKLGWVRLTADGGHAGNDLQHAAIRRWIAPMSATFTIRGAVKHDHAPGDGIRARIVSSRQGLLGQWTIHQKRAETNVESIALQKGDMIDFVVDYNANLNSDDFTWAPVVRLSGRSKASGSGEEPTEWNAKKDFSGPFVKPPRALDAWEKYAQVLLLSNEFMFVD